MPDRRSSCSSEDTVISKDLKLEDGEEERFSLPIMAFRITSASLHQNMFNSGSEAFNGVTTQ